MDAAKISHRCSGKASITRAALPTHLNSWPISSLVRMKKFLKMLIWLLITIAKSSQSCKISSASSPSCAPASYMVAKVHRKISRKTNPPILGRPPWNTTIMSLRVSLCRVKQRHSPRSHTKTTETQPTLMAPTPPVSGLTIK